MRTGFQLLLLTATSLAARVTLNSAGHFVDPDGRVRIFHGVNAVQKSWPWHPSTGTFDAQSSLNALDMANLKTWGFNTVRLGVMWPGVEPSPGQYNTTYLQVMRQMVDDLHKAGLYTIVDFHQDVIAQKWCGEGIPNWLQAELMPVETKCSSMAGIVGKIIGECKAFSDFNFSIDPATGYPATSDCLTVDFSQFSRTPDVASAWQNFYSNKSGAITYFENFWRTVSKAFAGADGVLGYDLINEPLPGNFYDHPSLLLAGNGDKDHLEPLYNSLGSIILAEDPEAVLFYEPTPFPDTYPYSIPVYGGVHSTGFTKGPAADSSQQVLSYHIYTCGFADGGCNTNGDPQNCDGRSTCDDFATSAVNTRAADARRLGGGAMVTEFGACGDTEACNLEIDRMTTRADSVLQSWAYWQFKYFDDITTVSGPLESFYYENGTLQQSKVNALSRTYATLVGGVPAHMKFARSSGAFGLKLTESTGLSTVIYLNQGAHYTGGYLLDVLNGTGTQVSETEIEVNASGTGLTVDVALVPKFSGATTGVYHSPDGDYIGWTNVEQAANVSVSLSSASNLSWWKSIKVFSDSGQLLCSLEMQDSDHGPKSCVLSGADSHALLFGYYIELWKAKTLGHHKKIDTIPSSYFGPLLARNVGLMWKTD